ncbi:Arylsulfatase precursor [Planctomycetes bacterium MalM25]|nr:Arylsulfatase precursor [Planctomycetes bacterium MalM25]
MTAKPTLAHLALLAAVLFVSASSVSHAERPPNLILIVTDDQGYEDVGFNGCQDIPTPHLDSIAEEGVRFTNGYVSFSVCGPSRAGFITGRYQGRFGFNMNPTLDPSNELAGVPLDEATLAETLRPAGYTSMAVGKWHLGTHPSLRPRQRGFDEFFGFLSGGHQYFPEQLTLQDFSEITKVGQWYRTKLRRNDEIVEIDDYLTDELSDAAADFVDRRHDEPFFLYLAYNAPHTPMQATKKYLDRFKHIEGKKRRTYAAMVSAVDDGVGRVLEKVAEYGIEERTLVVFFSDNGGATSNASSNKPLRGSKGTPFEGGVRVPFAARWTGTFPAGVDYDQPVISLDVFATMVALTGVTPNKPLDGVDLTPYVTGEAQGAPHDQLFWQWGGQTTLATRRGADKLIVGKKRTMLFDLDADLSEADNLADRRKERTEELSADATAWADQMKPTRFPGRLSWPKKD